MTKNKQQQIDSLCDLFRVLVDWAVIYDPKAEYKGQCTVNEKRRSATIYSWGRFRCPPDYLLHEVLHIAFRAAKARKREGEELFVQDLCKLMEGYPFKSRPSTRAETLER